MTRLSPPARRLFDLARGQDQPDTEARRRMARALALKIAAGSGMASAGVLPVAWKALAIKVALVAGISGGLGGGAWLIVHSPSSSPSTNAAPTTPVPAAPMEISRAEAPPRDEAQPQSGTEPAAALPSPRKPARALPHAVVAHRSAPTDVDQLVAETEALRQAQVALREKAPDRALRLLDEQDRRFAHGALPQERSAARILALCQLGRVVDARTQAVRFEREWPRSALLGRVRAACWEPAGP